MVHGVQKQGLYLGPLHPREIQVAASVRAQPCDLEVLKQKLMTCMRQKQEEHNWRPGFFEWVRSYQLQKDKVRDILTIIDDSTMDTATKTRALQDRIAQFCLRCNHGARYVKILAEAFHQLDHGILGRDLVSRSSMPVAAA